MIKFYGKYLDNASTNSIAHRLRRFGLFKKLLSSIEGQEIINILDIGGTYKFWINMNFANIPKFKITLINIFQDKLPEGVKISNIISKIGDATDLNNYPNQSVDIVFSNSVIEHVGTIELQRKMANEIRRIGKKYFIQTPSKNFPIEPHFHWPYFQYYPKKMAAFLAVNVRSIGWYHNKKDVYDIRLLNYKELNQLFPDAKIQSEKFWGLTKSFMIYNGF